jgi:hypothetical protein
MPARIAKATEERTDMSASIRKLLAPLAVALMCLAAPAAYAGDVAIDNSVRLDPFDPVPQIGFDHGCYDECGHRCEHSCYRHRRYRGCEDDCHRARWEEHVAIDRYEHQADTYDMLLQIYSDQLRWWQWRYRDGGHGIFRREDWHEAGADGWHDGDHHDGHDGDHHDGDHHDGDRHDGDWHDDGHHDGDHHDIDHHDGDGHHDGDWHDGDHHDGDHHDGDHHDGDHHDGDGHHDDDWHDGDHHHDGDGDHHDHHDGDGGWRDHDGNWHDGPPPDGYPHDGYPH